MIFLLAAAMLLSLACAAFCAGAETGFFSVNRGRVLHLAREGGKAAKTLQKALSDMPSTLAALLVGNNLAAVSFSSASAALASRLFPGGGAAASAWTLFAAFAILYLGEFLPKLFFSSRPLSRLVKFAGAFKIFRIVISPLSAAALFATGLFSGKRESRYKVTIGDLETILRDKKDGVKLTDFESALITRILVLRRKGESVGVDSLLEALKE